MKTGTHFNPRRGLLFWVTLFSLVLFLEEPCWGQKLLKNLRPDLTIPGNSDPYHFTPAGSFAYFWTNLPQGAVWRTDGTNRGTIKVLDKQGNYFSKDRPDGVSWKKLFFFAGFNPKTGLELFRSDGTQKGTFLLKDLFPGFGSLGKPNTSWPKDFVPSGAFLYFHAKTARGDTLFRTDGTHKGTVALFSSKGVISNLTAFSSKLVFQDKGTAFGAGGLGISDGTPGGTKIFANPHFVESGCARGGFAVLGNRFFFQGDRLFSNQGKELWVSDGTKAGTILFKDLWPGTQGSAPSDFAVVGSKLYFAAEEASHGRELWVSDGSKKGTVMFKDLAPGKVAGIPLSSHPQSLTPFGAGFLLSASVGNQGREPWISDGTMNGTKLLKDLAQGTSGSNPRHFLILGQTAFFFATPSPKVLALYRTNGTTSGTKHLTDLSASPSQFAQKDMDGLGKYVLFPRMAPVSGEEPWISDGTLAGTKILADLAPKRTIPQSSNPRSFVSLGDRVFFSAESSRGSTVLWESDGSGTGTTQTSIQKIGKQIFQAGDRLVWVKWENGRFFLMAYEKRARKPRILFSTKFQLSAKLFPFGNKLLFHLTDPVKGTRLWITDGKASGTRVFSPGPGLANDRLSEPLPFGKKVVFAGPYRTSPPTKALPIWITDGTRGGTKLLVSIPLPLPLFSAKLHSPVRIGKEFFFLSTLNLATFPQTVLWKTDGTAGGTIPLANFPYFVPSSLSEVHGKLVFAAIDPNHGMELWVSNGQPGGTKLLKDLFPGSKSSKPGNFRRLGGLLLFSASSPTTGKELYVTDGTDKGTKILRDIQPGAGSGLPLFSTLIRLGSRHLAFLADDGTTGKRLWMSDGTSKGTRTLPGPPLKDANLNLGLNHPSLLQGRLFFGWFTKGMGMEPWVWSPGASARIHGHPCGSEPRMRSGDPVLGGTFGIEGTLDPNSPTAILIFGLTAPSPLPTSRGCWLYVDPLRPLLPLPVQARQGKWNLSIKLPNQSSLTGLLLQAQVIHPLSGGGFDLSNPVELMLGN
jgi:ELWxxDGT repeat protein